MKEIKWKKLPAALVQALGAGVALSMVATATHAQQAQRVEKIEVTGSNIKRVDQETVAPVEIITRDQIERTGQATVAEVLRNIPANTGGSFGESFANSFASGAAGISLRGLGQKTTLVLLNGRRTTGYGFAQNLQDSFVDLNSIPSSAVERIEILKDGASAIYGSDAIAGVVNVILRKDYRGVEFGAGAGQSEGKNEYRANLTAGAGDLARDRWSAFGTLDYYKRDELLMSDTDFGSTRDFRQYPGGRNFNSLTAGGTWTPLTSTGALSGTTRRAMTDCTANGGHFYTAADAVAAGLLAATSALNNATNTWCGLDTNHHLSALPKAERVGFLGRATREFNPNATGYLELGLSHTENFQTFTPPSFTTTALQPTAAGLKPFAYNINFAPGVAGNPFTTAARFTASQSELGDRTQQTDSDTVRVLAGLTYTIKTWDLDSGLGWSRNDIDQDNYNRMSKAGVSSVFGVTSNPQPPIPTSTTSQYNLDRPSTNSQALRDSMLLDVKRKATSELSFVDTKASTELFKMAGGAAALALGAEYRREKLSDRPDQAAQSGDVLGQGITATDGSRNSYAMYAEMSLPFTRKLEAQIAGRYDHYSDYGSSSTPKVGIKFKATDYLLLRANWGKGFRAPTLPEISPSVATFFVQVNDPLTNLNGVQISGVFAGNPALDAEKSESTTAGFIFEPNQNFSFGGNYYRIDWRNLVTSQSFQDIVNTDAASRLSGGPGDPRVLRDPANNNQIVTVFNNYINVGKVVTDGVDVEARYRLNTDMGRITTRLNMTYMDSWKQDGVQYAGTNGQGNSGLPRLRSQLAVDWDYRALSTTIAGNYISGYYQQLLAGAFFAPTDPRVQNQVYPDRVPSYITYDAFAKYQLTKNFSVSGSIVNIGNRLPPYDPGISSTFLYDFSLYDIRGRQYRLGFKYTM